MDEPDTPSCHSSAPPPGSLGASFILTILYSSLQRWLHVVLYAMLHKMYNYTGPTLYIHLIACPLCTYHLHPQPPGTSGDHGHTCFLEADKSLANIRQLPHRAGHLRRRVTDKFPPPRPHTMGETSYNTNVILCLNCSNSQPKWLPSSHGHNPVHVPRRQGRQHAQIPCTIMTSAPLLPRYPGCKW